MRARQAATALLLGAGLLGFSPAVGGADVQPRSEARYDDPTNTFFVTDRCGDGVGTELLVQVGSGATQRYRVPECGAGTFRLGGAPEDARLAWRVCTGTVCSPWRVEDV